MPDVQNVFRRGGAYWWRRTLTWWGGEARPITLSLSLGTKDLGAARRRAAAMTAQSEVVRMSLYERVAREGLKPEQRDAVFHTEMRAYRDALRRTLACRSVRRSLWWWELPATFAPATMRSVDRRLCCRRRAARCHTA